MSCVETKLSLQSATMAAPTPFRGVRVEVISNQQLLRLFNNPDTAGNDGPWTRQSYIEATTDSAFSVKVSLTKLFQMGPCDAVRVQISFDGGEQSYFNEISRYPGLKKKPMKDRQVIFSNITHFCEDSGQRKSGQLCFGELVTSE